MIHALSFAYRTCADSIRTITLSKLASYFSQFRAFLIVPPIKNPEACKLKTGLSSVQAIDLIENAHRSIYAATPLSCENIWRIDSEDRSDSIESDDIVNAMSGKKNLMLACRAKRSRQCEAWECPHLLDLACNQAKVHDC